LSRRRRVGSPRARKSPSREKLGFIGTVYQNTYALTNMYE
jgi:hypothetical protein